MNSVSISTQTYLGKSIECAKFIIDTPAIWSLKSKIKIDSDYVFSFVGKANSNIQIQINLGGITKQIQLTTSFNRYKCIFQNVIVSSSPTTDVEILFPIGTFYIYNTQLEHGNIVTDWRAAGTENALLYNIIYNYDSTNNTIDCNYTFNQIMNRFKNNYILHTAFQTDNPYSEGKKAIISTGYTIIESISTGSAIVEYLATYITTVNGYQIIYHYLDNTISMVTKNFANLSHTHTTANITGFENAVSAIASTSISRAEILNKISTSAVYDNDYSFVEGSKTTATGYTSHAEGAQTLANYQGAHAEGYGTTACQYAAHSEGSNTSAYSNYSHAEGWGTSAGYNAHSEGNYSLASGNYAHSQNYRTTALGSESHAEGYQTSAVGSQSHVEGYQTSAIGNQSHAEGYQTLTSASYSHVEGEYCRALGDCSHAEGRGAVARGLYSHAEGYETQTSASYSHAEGRACQALASESHAEGGATTASGSNGHSEGANTLASAYASHAEGYSTIASNSHSHAEGWNTIASSTASHAEGYNTTASGNYSHAEGYQTSTSGDWGAHAEGSDTTASGVASHAEGELTIATGEASHAGGNGQALAKYAFAHGEMVVANQRNQFVIGQYNASVADALFIVGNGNDEIPSNAMYVTTAGNINCVSVTQTSDRRLKNDISNISTTDLAIYDKLQPKSFTLKSDDVKSKHYGFIAQDVLQSFEELGLPSSYVGIVRQDQNKQGYYNINYTEFIALLVEKQKIMQQEIDELKAAVAALKQHQS